MLIGNIGAEPKHYTLESGRKLAKFSIATKKWYRNDSNENVTQTQWHNVVAWGKVAEAVEKHGTKGRELAIEGELSTRTYEDKDGVKRRQCEIIIQEVLFL